MKNGSTGSYGIDEGERTRNGLTRGQIRLMRDEQIDEGKWISIQ